MLSYTVFYRLQAASRITLPVIDTFTCKQKGVRLYPAPLGCGWMSFHDVLKLDLKLVNAKRILVSTAVACFEALFLFRL